MKSGSWSSYQAALPHEARAGGARDDEPSLLEKRMNLTKDRKSGTEQALIAVGDGGTSAVILATDGPWLAADMEAVGSCNVEDIGLCDLPKKPGLYLFTGTARRTAGRWDGYDDEEIEWTAESLRPVPPEELPALLAMRPPESPAEPDAEYVTCPSCQGAGDVTAPGDTRDCCHRCSGTGSIEAWTAVPAEPPATLDRPIEEYL